MTLNLGSLLADSASRYASHVAVISDQHRLTYGELDDAVRRCARAMQRAGLERGDRVAIMLPNIPEFTIAYFAAIYNGHVVVTLNTLLSADEVAFQLTNSETRLLVVDAEFLETGQAGFGRSEAGELLYVTGAVEESLPAGATPFEALLSKTEHATWCRRWRTTRR
jgi:acyl-CoA synthetase (AMP-forming)/AMP-acid ligase II